MLRVSVRFFMSASNIDGRISLYDVCGGSSSGSNTTPTSQTTTNSFHRGGQKHRFQSTSWDFLNPIMSLFGISIVLRGDVFIDVLVVRFKLMWSQ
jgi:hypothetical protein